MKNLIAILLAVALMVTLAVNVCAEELPDDDKKATSVVYDVSPSYTVIIPSAVTGIQRRLPSARSLFCWKQKRSLFQSKLLPIMTKASV